MNEKEIKNGDIVYMITQPNILITVTNVKNGKLQGVYKNIKTNKLEYTPSIPLSTVVKVEQ